MFTSNDHYYLLFLAVINMALANILKINDESLASHSLNNIILTFTFPLYLELLSSRFHSNALVYYWHQMSFKSDTGNTNVLN